MTTTASSASTYTIDPQHSSVEFIAKHLVIAKVRGRFSGVSGTLTYDEAAKQLVGAHAVIDATTLDTREADRDAHLKSGDFLLTESHPTITFESTAISHAGSSLDLIGDLTIRGVTKSVQLKTEHEGEVTDGYGNQRVVYTAEGEINRREFGLEFNMALEAGGLVVGDKVKLELNIQAIKAK